MSETPRIYRSLSAVWTKEEIARTMREGKNEELMLLSLSLGEYFSDWKFAQDICLRLAEHAELAVRANAVLGLSYIARTKRRLEKHLVKPVLLREWRRGAAYRGQIEDAIGDINMYLCWNIRKYRKFT